MKGVEEAVISWWEVALFPCHHSEQETKGSPSNGMDPFHKGGQ